jgi:hypothetical protein
MLGNKKSPKGFIGNKQVPQNSQLGNKQVPQNAQSNQPILLNQIENILKNKNSIVRHN